jgi:hypothetical protein
VGQSDWVSADWEGAVSTKVLKVTIVALAAFLVLLISVNATLGNHLMVALNCSSLGFLASSALFNWRML